MLREEYPDLETLPSSLEVGDVVLWRCVPICVRTGDYLRRGSKQAMEKLLWHDRHSMACAFESSPVHLVFWSVGPIYMSRLDQPNTRDNQNNGVLR
jgi:hypothetical protein